MAVHAAGGLSVPAVGGVLGRGVHGTARGVHGGRHMVSVMGVGRRTVLAMDGRRRCVDRCRRQGAQSPQLVWQTQRHDGPREDRRRRSAQPEDCRCRPLQERSPPLRGSLPVRKPCPQRRMVLRHVLSESAREKGREREGLSVGVARPVRGLPLVYGLWQDVE